MLHLPETDLKKTRFYQEVLQEGTEIGEKLGEMKGERAMVLRQLKRRLGGLTAGQQAQIERLSADDLGALGEALLDFADARALDAWLQGNRTG